MDQQQWAEILKEAAMLGLVESAGLEIFRMLPGLIWFLRQRLNQFAKATAIARLEKQLIRFYSSLSAKLDLMLINDVAHAMGVASLEEPNLLRHLRRAEQICDWGSAQAILSTLGEMYQRRARDSEFIALRKRGMQSVGQSIEAVKSKGSAAVAF